MRPTGVVLALAASLCGALAVHLHADAGPQPGQEFRYSGTCVITVPDKSAPDYHVRLNLLATLSAREAAGLRVLRFRSLDYAPLQQGTPPPPSEVDVWSCLANPAASMRPSSTKLTPAVDMVDCLSLPQPLGTPDQEALSGIRELPVFNQPQMPHTPIYVRQRSLGIVSLQGHTCIHIERTCASALPIALSYPGQLTAYQDQLWIDQENGVLVRYEGTAVISGMPGSGSEQRITNTLELTGTATLSPGELQHRAEQERALETIAKIADTEALPSPDEANPLALQAAKAQLTRFEADAPGSPYLPAARSLHLQVEHALAVANRTRKQAGLVGQPAPDVVLQDPDGSKHSLRAYRGKTVLLTFFASWCGPCNDEAPEVEANVWQKRRDHGVVVVGIDTSEESDPAGQARAFRTRHRLTYPILLDTFGSAAQAFGVQAIPVNVIVDGAGTVRYVKTGYDPEAVASMLDSLQK